ncbi:glycosyltransferase family 39 protein [candidate division KSB1 bacterium]|nr:glycosyltransferase family 39 protein [candidate division KSB1 bacterium]
MKNPPYGAWATCREWKTFVQADSRFCFSIISRDLMESDVHPPLYFWLLHLFSLVNKVKLSTGIWLNMLLVCLSSLLLWKLALQVCQDERLALFAVALWAWSPAVIPISLEARPYELLALAAILFVLELVRFADSSGRRRTALIGLSFATLLGVLTHYHFYILLFCGLIYIVYLSIRMRLKSILMALIAIMVALLAGHFVHPGLFKAIKRMGSELIFFDGIIKRLDRTALAASSFLSNIHLFQYILIAVGIYFLISFMVKYRYRRTTWRRETSPAGAVLFLGFGFFFITVFLFILGFSPAHAMGEKYLCVVWPLAAVFAAALLTLKDVRHQLLPVFIMVFIFLQSAIILSLPFFENLEQRDIRSLLRKPDAVVVDNVARGELLRLIWYVPEDKQVFAANQSDLLQQPAWSRDLTCNTMFISKCSYGNTAERQKEILKKWPLNCELIRFNGSPYLSGQLFFAADR